ncbi:MAG TPA: alkaline phosphatase PhoX, partial [Candidatus Saccharimonadia bacterium]|nr:alkaline phosphatase PhoX [Candidatus Saccharimonadia bacterium]
FRHEAAVVHEPSGHVYMTEDREPRAGFYRFVPARRERLAGRGVLEMLKLARPRELRGALPLGTELAVEWVRVEHPDRAHTPGTTDGLGVFTQGHDRGGAVFARGEGCHATRDAIYFTATNGGAGACGQLFAYYPFRQTLALLFESPDPETLDYPDNVCFSPRGGLVICEDGVREGKLLQGLSATGGLFPFARNDVVLHGAPFGHAGDFRRAEWAGACFSRDGRWLFANVYSPGFSVAITGPWRSGLI